MTTFPPIEPVPPLTEEQVAGIIKELKRLKCCSICESELNPWERKAGAMCHSCLVKAKDIKKKEHLSALASMSIEERVAILEAFTYEHKQIDHTRDSVMR